MFMGMDVIMHACMHGSNSMMICMSCGRVFRIYDVK